MVVVVDDENRENEGDLIMAAEGATQENMAFFPEHTGLICVSIEDARATALDLLLMVADNSEAQGTAFTVSVDYRAGTSTGISAADRATTLVALADERTKPDDLSRPGHVFPLRSRPGGVLARPGHTEAAMDLVKPAGLFPAGVLCELTSADKLGWPALLNWNALRCATISPSFP
jgi:3,4-dihydroxy-2-butanone 4-phosphate synthase